MPINEIKLVGRTFLINIQIGNRTRIVEITMKQFNEMLDKLPDNDNLPPQVLDRMSEICRRNFRKGKLARRLRPDTISHIKEGYSQFFGRPWETICAANRHAEFIETRMRICGHLVSLKYVTSEIAAFFIDRDRSTIDGAIKRCQGLCETDKSFELNSNMLATFMEKWMLDTYTPRTQQAVESLPEIQFESEGSIHTSTDKARIADESTKAADAIGKVIIEEWGTAPEPPKPIGDMVLKDWIQ